MQPCVCGKHLEGEPRARDGIEKQWRQAFVNEVANFEGFEKVTCFLREAMTNILSFLLVKSEYTITY